eukprot:s119_g38.t1
MRTTVHFSVELKSIHWIFNHAIGADCKWQTLRYDVLRPLLVPPRLQEFGTVFACDPNLLELVAGSISIGTTLTRKQLEDLQKMISYKVVEKGKGAGKNGNVVKYDYATGLVKHYFPSADDDELQRMIGCLMGNTKIQLCPEEVLEVISQMDPKTREDWTDLKDMANAQRALHKRAKDAPKATPPQASPETAPFAVAEGDEAGEKPEKEIIMEVPAKEKQERPTDSTINEVLSKFHMPDAMPNAAVSSSASNPDAAASSASSSLKRSSDAPKPEPRKGKKDD